jgi:hypothetical protein
MAGEEEISESEFLRREFHSVINRYPNMTVYQTIGVLETVKMDIWDQLERHHQQEPPESPP